MATPTKILYWSEDEAEGRVEAALRIMERLDVDPIHWEAVFAAVMLLLSGAALQQTQEIPLRLPRGLTG